MSVPSSGEAENFTKQTTVAKREAEYLCCRAGGQGGQSKIFSLVFPCSPNSEDLLANLNANHK
ncbi:hypothetical protein ACEYW6_13415 [Nostoc sp. UIC 10607]|uniref:Uncharacterized protein n=2 Tax=Nostoc TaxID=1177 RepID=A0ABR8I068_9NOSO|nr:MULTISPECIES: hypothetical protein [Nostoc]MBD2564584.1 hypothetical protein [Nostoc linckia FACHB-391]MBD2645023.1 hypothetical protein [Nostoc foliaceum FACHB-393]